MKPRNTPGSEKAMIVEDEKDLSYLLSIVLKQSNISPACVHSIKEARESIQKLQPSIIFLDNHLPDGLGADFIAHAKAMHPATKVIMMTAHDSPRDVKEAFTKGADYFITKPFDVSTIKSTIDLFMHGQTG